MFQLPCQCPKLTARIRTLGRMLNPTKVTQKSSDLIGREQKFGLSRTTYTKNVSHCNVKSLTSTLQNDKLTLLLVVPMLIYGYNIPCASLRGKVNNQYVSLGHIQYHDLALS